MAIFDRQSSKLLFLHCEGKIPVSKKQSIESIVTELWLQQWHICHHGKRLISV